MKKLLLIIAILGFLIGISSYIFIPSTLNISKVVIASCKLNSAFRVLSDTANWQKWWPPETEKDSIIFKYKDDKYTYNKLLYSAVGILINHKNMRMQSQINLLPINEDSIAILWQCSFRASNNPLNRIANYFIAVSIKNNFSDILSAFKSYIEVQQNIYGLKIIKSSTTDTLLIATKIILEKYPSTTDIYAAAALLTTYAEKNSSPITGHLMLNVTPLGNNKYEMMVALPTNVELQNEGNIFFRRMVPGNFLTTEVTGGDSTIAHAMAGMKLYMNDYEKISMAIPFQSLLTDRSAEKDTSKWITKLYFPIER